MSIAPVILNGQSNLPFIFESQAIARLVIFSSFGAEKSALFLMHGLNVIMIMFSRTSAVTQKKRRSRDRLFCYNKGSGGRGLDSVTVKPW